MNWKDALNTYTPTEGMKFMLRRDSDKSTWVDNDTDTPWVTEEHYQETYILDDIGDTEHFILVKEDKPDCEWYMPESFLKEHFYRVD